MNFDEAFKKSPEEYQKEWAKEIEDAQLEWSTSHKAAMKASANYFERFSAIREKEIALTFHAMFDYFLEEIKILQATNKTTFISKKMEQVFFASCLAKVEELESRLKILEALQATQP